jgi:hypothetical protein
MPSTPDIYLGKATDWTTQAEQRGLGAYQKGQDYLGEAGDFWSSLLGGDRTKIMSTLTPEISSLTESYDKAQKDISALSPRGGKSTAMAESRFGMMGQIQDLISKTRTTAAQQLGAMGIAETGIGQMDTSQVGSMLQGIFESLLSAQSGLQIAKTGASATQSGSAIGTMLALLAMSGGG